MAVTLIRREGRVKHVKFRICSSEAAVRLEYANLRLCRDHFIAFFERRVGRTIRRYGMLPPGSKVAVALSKAKMVALFSPRWRLKDRLEIEVTALTIVPGIVGYDEAYFEAVRGLYEGALAPSAVPSKGTY